MPGYAGLAQLVEHELPKLEVVGSNPMSRSESRHRKRQKPVSFAELAGLTVSGVACQWTSGSAGTDLEATGALSLCEWWLATAVVSAPGLAGLAVLAVL
jgi:hypothetical protein